MKFFTLFAIDCLRFLKHYNTVKQKLTSVIASLKFLSRNAVTLYVFFLWDFLRLITSMHSFFLTMPTSGWHLHHRIKHSKLMQITVQYKDLSKIIYLNYLSSCDCHFILCTRVLTVRVLFVYTRLSHYIQKNLQWAQKVLRFTFVVNFSNRL